MSETLKLLENFLAHSRAMLQAAEDESWELLEEMMGEREAMQARLPVPLETHLLPAEYDRASALIQECLALDHQSMALVDERMKLIAPLANPPHDS